MPSSSQPNLLTSSTSILEPFAYQQRVAEHFFNKSDFKEKDTIDSDRDVSTLKPLH